MKIWKLLIGAVALTAAASSHAFAGASDFAFEALKQQVKKGNAAIVAVRLLDKRTGKSVPDAIIVAKRIDMAPENMADMASPLNAAPSNEPGVYAFKTNLSMAGGWLLTISAKVQGEPETVTGKVTFKAID
ncbi:MAG TPA: FixH family protein [Xanthobacteraceae bacterium]|nr:FixH family protein [Xanthobacteraceae bacterium]